MKKLPFPTAEEFFAQTMPIPESGCWVWMGSSDIRGYGRIARRHHGKRLSVQAHRYAYELHYGPIPDRLEIDHLCRVLSCVNPAHLEAVTHAVNVKRGQKGVLRMQCKWGHPFNAETLRLNKNGTRSCRPCERRRKNEKYWTNLERERAKNRARWHRSKEKPCAK
jgi:hypothetical protein